MHPRTIVKKLIPASLFRAIEPYGHLLEAMIAQLRTGFPAKGMKVIGITGTNGKTTTTFLVHRMLHEAGYKVGLMSTVAYGTGLDIKPQPNHMTTMPAPLLLKNIKSMKEQGVEWLVLETTSHALAQHRVWGIPYSVGVLTNITHEHLDYHGTFERYVAAKRRLFQLVQKNKKGLQTGIANADDEQGESFAHQTAHPVLYGIKKGDLQAKNIVQTASGIKYDIFTPNETYEITSQLPGSFNIYNSLAAVSVGRALGLSKEQIQQGIAALPGVAGRMERVDAGQAFAVIVDYAHTPDALQNVLTALRASTTGQLAVVFGATGDRDKSKRPIMGQVAARTADKIFLTDDETYTEDPDTIRSAVEEGITLAGGKLKTTVIPDRLEAIRQAFKTAQPGDTVLLAGIGHQDYRAMGGSKQPWDERQVARQLLQELKP